MCTRDEEQHEEWLMQMQIHRDNMRQQSQFMTTVMWAMMGNQGAWTSSIISPVIPRLGINHGHEAMQRKERICAARERGRKMQREQWREEW